MSGSVWFGQVDKALKELIPTKVYTLNESGVHIPIPAIVTNPESEFKLETFPSATIQNVDYEFDTIRYTRGNVVVSKDYTTGKAIVENSAKPYNLIYQIDLWAKYNTDINLMTMLWATHFEKFNVLTAIDTGGNTRRCDMILRRQTNLDSVRYSNERILRRSFTYEIKVELDEAEAEASEINIVLTTEIINNRGDFDF